MDALRSACTRWPQTHQQNVCWGSIGAIEVVADAALLRGVGALDFGCRAAPFSGVPGYLLRDVRQVGGVQVGIHGPRLVLHAWQPKLFVGELRAGVFGKALVDRAVVSCRTGGPGAARSCCLWRAVSSPLSFPDTCAVWPCAVASRGRASALSELSVKVP